MRDEDAGVQDDEGGCRPPSAQCGQGLLCGLQVCETSVEFSVDHFADPRRWFPGQYDKRVVGAREDEPVDLRVSDLVPQTRGGDIGPSQVGVDALRRASTLTADVEGSRRDFVEHRLDGCGISTNCKGHQHGARIASPTDKLTSLGELQVVAG